MQFMNMIIAKTTKAKQMNEIIEKLKTAQQAMIDAGVAMDYLGGFDAEIVEKSREILNASCMVGEWIEHLSGKE